MATKKKARKSKTPASETASRGNGGGEEVSTVQEPPAPDPDRAEYTPDEAKDRKNRGDQPNPNDVPRQEDKIYDIASRDRWANESNEDHHQRQVDARDAEAAAAAAKE